MFRASLLRQLAREAVSPRTPRIIALRARRFPAASPRKALSTSPCRFKKDALKDDIDAATTSGKPGASGDHEGKLPHIKICK